MSYEVNGQTLEADDHGYLTNLDSWSEDAAKVIAETQDIELTDKHMDVLNFLRDRYINHGNEQPNMRNLAKGMANIWGVRKVDSKALYDLFPMGPAKQACMIAGLPETKRKGGY